MTSHDLAPTELASEVLRAGHPRLAVLMAAGAALTAGLIGRSVGQIIVIGLTVLIGQLVIGWHNDLVDEPDDRRHQRDKPLVTGQLRAEELWTVLGAGTVLVAVLATAGGTQSAPFYAASMLVAMAGNVLLRTGPLSFVTWAGSYALLVPYLSFSSKGGHAAGSAPEPAMVACFALLGIGVHAASALRGLVADSTDGWTYLPLQLGRRFGAAQTMAMAIFYLAGVGVTLAYVAHTHGFSR